MKTAFVDTLYWIAVIKPGDPWKEAASQARTALGKARLVTTDEVLTEFLNHLAGYGENYRRQAIKMVREILKNPNMSVLPQTRDTFQSGMKFYEERQDKEYSLTDCISMNTMKSENIIDILTKDQHFTQEGFNALISRESRDTK
jgi:uncharacterized protein